MMLVVFCELVLARVPSLVLQEARASSQVFSLPLIQYQVLARLLYKAGNKKIPVIVTAYKEEQRNVGCYLFVGYYVKNAIPKGIQHFLHLPVLL